MRRHPVSEPASASRRTAPSATDGRAGSSTRAATIGLCVFDLPAGRFALDVGMVGEVVTVERAVAVPRAPRGVVGLFNLRGGAIALVDLAVVLDMPGATPALGATPLALVLRQGPTTLAAIQVTAVVTVLAAAAVTPVAADRAVDHPAVAAFVTTSTTGVVSLLDDAYVQQRIATLRSR